MNILVGKLADITTQIGILSETINESTEQILITNANQIHYANEQSSAIAQVSATIDEFRANNNNFTRQVKTIATQATNTQSVSETGQQAIVDSVYSMGQIKERVSDISDSTHLLGEHIQQIEDIIKTVNEYCHPK